MIIRDGHGYIGVHSESIDAKVTLHLVETAMGREWHRYTYLGKILVNFQSSEIPDSEVQIKWAEVDLENYRIAIASMTKK